MSPAITGGGGPGSASPVYRNPFRNASVTPSRIDQGVDYNGRAGDPIYALGRGTVIETFPYGGNSGWPGGGWVSYRLEDGPSKGMIVYVAEDTQPAVTAGQKVTANTVVAHFAGPGSIETGYAGPPSAGDQTLAYYNKESDFGSSDIGGWNTLAGAEFSNLLASTGAPAGIPQSGGVHGPGGGIVTGFKYGKGGATGGKGVSGTVSGSSATGEGPNCLLGWPGVNVNVPVIGQLGGGGFCLITRKRARTFAGIGLVLAGGGLLLVGTLILAAYGLKGTGAGKAAGRATEAAGAAIAAVPGGEVAGAATVAAGHAKVKRSEQTRQRRTAPAPTRVEANIARGANVPVHEQRGYRSAREMREREGR